MAKTSAVMNVVPDVVMARKIYLSVKEELLRLDDNNTGMGLLALQFRILTSSSHASSYHINKED